MSATTMPKIDGATIASMELEERGVFGPPLGEPLDGPMATARREIWRSADGAITVGVWECAPGRFWTAFEAGEGEFICLVGGRLTCVEAGGPTTHLGPGDAMTFPPGWQGEWRIEGKLRKVFAGWAKGAPQSSQGADESTPPPKIDGATVASMELDEQEPFARIDGGSLGTRGRTTWKAADGSVETGVWECDAGRFHADFGAYGELVYVVSGEVVCTPDDDGGAFTLRAGDAATFPRGWTGEWDVCSPLRKLYALWDTR